MNWKIDWNIVTLGRAAGIAIIMVGIVLAALDASAFNLGPSSRAGSYFRYRYFLGDAIGFAWKGGLVFAGAEIADRFGWGGRRSIDWHGVRLVRLLGVAVMSVGIGVTAWNATDLEGIRASAVIRLLMQGFIGAAWGGGMLLLAAELADRIGWRDVDAQDTAAELPA